MNLIRRYFLSLLLLLFIHAAFAGKVDTVKTFSSAMNKTIKAVVIRPDSYAKNKVYPVFYLLHGYGGNYASWVNSVPQIVQASDTYQMIIVCADGGIGSWYFDSPLDPQWKYETYVSKELVSWVDVNYHTIASPAGRAIAGFSMGGHGALYLAIRHQDVFGAAGSLSGGVDFRPFPKNWEIARRLGTYANYPENWEKNTVINMLQQITPGALALLIDCGTEDFFYQVNKELHDKLLELHIAHDYISRPGAHNWPYWGNSIDFQMLYMNKFFHRTSNN
ncbi:alpha/beta hydrolase [Arcticibacter eurypsychrophilus]|uniref:alpha/beta hydrolase n=1 Tax=Arcticibacter eurypsychrophilus TaxID=1434752 RepID=UPI00084DDDDA|nr:alpha/beta hydrolase family protein [Arcticibacter eurypsychrophilus]